MTTDQTNGSLYKYDPPVEEDEVFMTLNLPLDPAGTRTNSDGSGSQSTSFDVADALRSTVHDLFMCSLNPSTHRIGGQFARTTSIHVAVAAHQAVRQTDVATETGAAAAQHPYHSVRPAQSRAQQPAGQGGDRRSGADGRTAQRHCAGRQLLVRAADRADRFQDARRQLAADVHVDGGHLVDCHGDGGVRHRRRRRDRHRADVAHAPRFHRDAEEERSDERFDGEGPAADEDPSTVPVSACFGCGLVVVHRC